MIVLSISIHNVAGSTAATLVVALLNMKLTVDDMRQFGWRLPFLSSLIVAVLALISQRGMEGSHEFISARKHGKIVQNPVLFAVKYHWKSIGFIFLSVAIWSAGIYMTDTFLPIYAQHKLGVDYALLIGAGIQILRLPLFALSGHLADLYGEYPLFKYGTIILFTCSFPLYLWMNREYVDHEQSTFLWPFIVTAVVSEIGLGLCAGSMLLVMVSTVGDVTIRMSALGIAYNLSLATFGGTAPTVGSCLSIKNLSFVGGYLSTVSALSFVTVYFMERRRKRR